MLESSQMHLMISSDCKRSRALSANVNFVAFEESDIRLNHFVSLHIRRVVPLL